MLKMEHLGSTGSLKMLAYLKMCWCVHTPFLRTANLFYVCTKAGMKKIWGGIYTPLAKAGEALWVTGL